MTFVLIAYFKKKNSIKNMSIKTEFDNLNRYLNYNSKKSIEYCILVCRYHGYRKNYVAKE